MKFKGDIGDKFYLLEEGDCVCLKVMKPGILRAFLL